MYGTASEHCVLYQYMLDGAQGLVMGMVSLLVFSFTGPVPQRANLIDHCQIQTESPYFFPQPTGPTPFEKSLRDDDPKFADCGDDDTCKVSWALYVKGATKSIYVLGAGLYSWFYDEYYQDCIEAHNCQSRILYVGVTSTISIFNLTTIGSDEMISPQEDVAYFSKDNLVLQDRSPWMSVIAAWIKDKPGTLSLSGNKM